jgi:putative peptidoglycan lipid II flippase
LTVFAGCRYYRPMSSSVYKKVGIASAIMMASIFLSRVAGLLREMVIAYVGGARGEVDAYQVAFVIPEILNHILASGFLSVTFIPIFSRYLAQDREDEGWRVFSNIMTCFGSFMVLLITITFVLSPTLIGWIAPGLKNPVLIQSAVKMTRIILPAQFFFFAGGLLMAVQFAREKFLIPALAPLIYNIGIILGGLLLGPWLHMEGFSWGVLAGAFIGNFVIQAWGASKAGMRFHLSFQFTHPDLKQYILLTLPLMLGLTMTFSTEIFLKFFGSFLPEGRIASLNYGFRVMLILVAFFGQAVGVASFPFMARMAAENRIQELNRLLNTALRYLVLVIPFSILIMVLRQEVVMILFQRGRFDAIATQTTSQILIFLMTGAVAFGAQTVVVRGYYAMQDTLFPTLYATIAVIASIPFYILGMRYMGANGVALAVSLSSMFQVALIYAIWNRRTSNTESTSVYIYFGKMVLLSIPIGLFLEWIKNALYAIIPPSGFIENLGICTIIGTLFFGIFISCGHLFRITEISDLMMRFFSRLQKQT